MQLGKMYLVKELFWFLYPTKEVAEYGRSAGAAARRREGQVANNAKLLSESFNCNVSFVEENTCVVLLEVDDDYYKFLDCNGNIGWIICQDFSNYFELVKE